MTGLVTMVLLVVIASTAWRYWLKVQPPAPAAGSATAAPSRAAPETPPSFTCSGKAHCSQMTSCAEAKFYINNCPGTQMDGDNDGQPCKNMCGH